MCTTFRKPEESERESSNFLPVIRLNIEHRALAERMHSASVAFGDREYNEGDRDKVTM